LCHNKDIQVLYEGGPQMCPTNPRWRTAAFFKKLKKTVVTQQPFDQL